MSGPLRVMTWNLWWRFGPWEQRQAAIATVLADERADVICLQEVWAEDSGRHQAAELAKGLGFFHARSAAPYWEGLAFENAILSRWPILSVEVAALPNATSERGHRSALLCWIDAPFGPLAAVCTHLEYRFDQGAVRLEQARALCAFVARHRGDPETAFPVVLGADLNAMPDSDEVRAMTGRSVPLVPGLLFQDVWELAGDRDQTGWTWDGRNPYCADATWPNRRIDYIGVSWPRPKPIGTPLRAWNAGVRPIGGVQPSDHFAVVADLRTS